MSLGVNRAKDYMRQYIYANEENIYKKSCIFLSHRSLDKPVVRMIASYIAKAGIDYYLDEEDAELQQADEEGNDNKTVECIQNGIRCSSHILCILSDTTIHSWWVPYEIGYGENENRNIASIKIKNLSESEIPAYLRVRNCMMGLEQLNKYLEKVPTSYGGLLPSNIKAATNVTSYNLAEEVVLSTYDSEHPLFEIIDM